ncbi:DUF4440 domain-containing protein [Gemmatimonadota bacterium]
MEVDRLKGEFYALMIEKVREVMAAWEAAWEGTGPNPLHATYSPQALLLQPGGMPLRGRDAIRGFSESALPVSREVLAGLRDLDATEGMAFFTGSYAIQPSRADRAPNTGRHFTVVALEGDDWLIRAQFLLADTASPAFPGNISAELLEPLTNDQVRSGRRGQNRIAAYGDAQFVLSVFRDAWNRRDAEDAASFFWEDAQIQLPNESGSAPTGPLVERLKRAYSLHSGVFSVDLDFDQRDRLSYTLGRYHAEGRAGPEQDKTGHFMLVLKHSGTEWKIRALIFS